MSGPTTRIVEAAQRRGEQIDLPMGGGRVGRWLSNGPSAAVLIDEPRETGAGFARARRRLYERLRRDGEPLILVQDGAGDHSGGAGYRPLFSEPLDEWIGLSGVVPRVIVSLAPSADEPSPEASAAD